MGMAMRSAVGRPVVAPIAYRLTDHALKRMAQRRIAPEEVLAALHKRGTRDANGIVEHFDPRTGVTVKVAPLANRIITIYRRQPACRRKG